MRLLALAERSFLRVLHGEVDQVGAVETTWILGHGVLLNGEFTQDMVQMLIHQRGADVVLELHTESVGFF